MDQTTVSADKSAPVQPTLFPLAVLLSWECVPESKRLVASSCDDGFALGTHGEVENTVRVPCECSNHRKRGISPDADLVLGSRAREPMGADQFMGCERPNQIADLHGLK